MRPSGRLEQVARIELDASGDELATKAMYLHSYYADKPDTLQLVKTLTGHTPLIEGTDTDSAMS